MTAAMKSKPVWVWLPGKTEPVRCGTFTWRVALGRFVYDRGYLSGGGAVAPVPVRIPLSRSARPQSESRLDGLFGVFRDASPEGFGLDLLKQCTDKPLTDPLEILELSAGDGVGAIAVCDDIAAKAHFKPYPLDSLNQRLTVLGPEQCGSSAIEALIGERFTALGGERPKLTFCTRSNSGSRRCRAAVIRQMLRCASTWPCRLHAVSASTRQRSSSSVRATIRPFS